MLGSAMRRLRVKNSASAQADGGDERRRPAARARRDPGARRKDWPIQPTATSRITAAIADENVVEAGQQPEMLLVDGRSRAARGDMVAKRLRGLRCQRSGRDRRFQIALAVHGQYPPWCRAP